MGSLRLDIGSSYPVRRAANITHFRSEHAAAERLSGSTTCSPARLAATEPGLWRPAAVGSEASAAVAEARAEQVAQRVAEHVEAVDGQRRLANTLTNTNSR